MIDNASFLVQLLAGENVFALVVFGPEKDNSSVAIVCLLRYSSVLLDIFSSVPSNESQGCGRARKIQMSVR